MNVRLLSLFPLITGCAIVVQGLEPRPNIPEVTSAPPIAIELGPDVKQQQTLAVGNAEIELRTFRGDVKRAFYAGFPGATEKQVPLVLKLTSIEMTYENLRVAGMVRLRFRGSLDEGGTTVVTFASKVQGEICTDTINSCFRSAIEAMFERVFAELGNRPAPSREPPVKGRPTEI